MAVTVVATPGSASANSYATIAEADTYHEAHPHAAAWDDADDDQKGRALVTATRLLDELFVWKGSVVDDVQALLWPRSGVYEWSGYAVAEDAIPARLRNATAEYARVLIEDEEGQRLKDNDLLLQGIKRVKAGPVEIEASSFVATSQPIPDSVVRMIPEGYGKLRGRGPVTIQRG